jgi:predicted GNAT family N-acyltransferase
MTATFELDAVWQSPTNCSKSELSTFRDMVLLGGEVSPHGLAGRVENAERLAFCREHDLIVGVAGLKKPSNDYRMKTGRLAQLDLSEEFWPWEFGWVFVSQEARGKGVSRRLVNCAIDGIAEPVFATSRAANSFTHSPLRAAGFVQKGRAYVSDRHGGEMVVFQRVGR